MSKFLASFTNLLNISQNVESAPNNSTSKNDKIFVSEDIFIQKGVVTGLSKDFVTIDKQHSVHKSRIAEEVGEVEVGDWIVFKAEEFDQCDNVLEIIERTDKAEVLQLEDWVLEKVGETNLSSSIHF